MKTTTSLSKNSVHFVGVGGIGISALAQWFLAQKWAVSGSDIVASGLTRKLQKEGVKVTIGHKKSHVGPKTSLVIYNQAIPPSNPELREAKRLKIPTFTYPEALGSLTRGFKTIAVAGAHGKSTTTALASLVFTEAGLDPTVILGTLLKQLGGKNFRAGKSDYLLIEADEWKASFLNYSPLFSIITNVDKEHLDFYKNYSNVKKTFLKFISNIREGGILVVNKDDKKLYALKSKIQKIAKHNNLKVIWYGAIINYSARNKIKKVLRVPGEHNVSNALAVYTLARALGIKEKTALEGLAKYRGAWRRMEYKGELKDKNKESRIRGGKKNMIHDSKFMIPVYDDYAHHPTEIKASLQAFREKFSNRKIICVFQPHQAHRTQNLFKEFISAFDEADFLVLLPIYQVAGRDKPHKGYSSKDLAEKIGIRNKELGIKNYVTYLPHPKRLRSFIRDSEFIIHDSVIVMMGAGDIVNYTDLLIK